MVTFKDYVTEATKHWYAFKDVPKANNDLGKFIQKSKSSIQKDDHDFVYFDDKYDYKNPKKRIIIKVTDRATLAQMNAVALKMGHTSEVNKNGFIIQPLNAQLYLSGGVRGTGALPRHGVKALIPTTSEQEVGSVYYISQKIKGKSPTLKQIIDAVGFEFSPDWLHNFEEHWRGIDMLFGGRITSKHKVYLDSNKALPHQLVLDTAKRVGLKDSKDNWNPSDVWISSLSKSEIASDMKEMKSLPQLNAWLDQKFESHEFVGVSLKKIPKSKKSTVKVINNRDLPVVNLHVSRVLFDPMQTNFILETTGGVSGFNIRVGYKSSSESLLIFLEGRMKGANVQLGAVSAKIVKEEFAKSGINVKDSKLDPVKMDIVLKKLTTWHPVINKGNLESFSELEGFTQKRAMYLTNFLDAFRRTKDIQKLLETFYYSAIKQNKFSSIHAKIS